MQLYSKSTLLFTILAAQPIAAAPAPSAGSSNAAVLSPSAVIVVSGVNSVIGLGGILGDAGFDSEGRIGYDNGLDNGHGGGENKFTEKKIKAIKHANEHMDVANVKPATNVDAGDASEDAHQSKADLIKFKKVKLYQGLIRRF
ncbi:hypothetical protein A4X13_0g5172 [Tilletia indica]|uniref:Uncharacterized protein n=1 Tax=Tilletia indica TaxID=43049 RepID=A0A177TEY5_9BASI|nr:hypothetical protein A4X13_0g5172 [Tilletia indica]